MSIRSLIEINHDFCADLGVEFLRALRRYVRSANREAADDLARFGVKVIGQRHHSGNFYLDGPQEGFPVTVVERTPKDPPHGK